LKCIHEYKKTHREFKLSEPCQTAMKKSRQDLKKISTSPDAIAVDQACSADGATAGCAGKQLSTGLLKCIIDYKKGHQDFKLSDGCRAAVKKMHEDRKARK
ncbi:MAG: hypothetical protein WCG27_10305, partial [Pseudomonadota bacterium]